MRKLVRALAIAVPFVLVGAACGSDDPEEAATTTQAEAAETTAAPAAETTAAPTDATDAATGDEPDAAGLTRAQEIADGAAEPTTKIGPTVPLDSAPPKDITVAWLECEVTCEAFRPGFQQATDALGWKLEVIPVQSFDPAAGFQQAFDLGANYIAITGTPPALVQDQIDTAKEKGIPIMSCYEVTEPLQEENNIWMQCGDDANVNEVGYMLSNKIIADSGGNAHELMVNIPDFPILVSEREGAERAYAENCATCTFTELPVTLDQLLAGEVAGAIVSALQSDPTINYVRFAFDSLGAGVTTTLADAGLLEQVTLVGQDANAASLQEIVDGTNKFWTTNPVQYAGWLMVDAMARHSIGQENTEERSNSALPTFIVEDAATAEELIPSGDWPGPDGMADQFTALWGVG